LAPSRRVGAKVRARAAQIVAQVVEERRSVEELLGRETELPARDRALLAALVLGALRWHPRLEWQAAQLLARPMRRDQATLAALLRVGLLQLQDLRIPPHAAVSATVDAAASIGARAAAPLVNAVLRRFQREHERLAAAAPSEARYAHPGWIIAAVRGDYADVWESILEANNELPPMWLRVNLARTTRERYLAELAAGGLSATPATDVASAVRLADPQAVESLPGFAQGLVSVQDVAAQRAAGFLALAPGQRVLDACAAPGGKTGHILEATAGRSEVWAVDRDAARLERVADNLARLGATATLVAGDATTPRDWWDGKPFDRILLDAPCSGFGVIRRHPDIKVRRTAANVDRVTTLQAALLDALWPLLAPGGLLLYATCTVLKRENEQQIAAFRARASTIAADRPGVASSRQFLPGEADGDGFYYAWLRKAEVS
jgi:16S rRNA (cytosine967-C5)-methyltransferase